ncbi:caf17 [Acrasis kona]|uniref:Caf17 n=1 Tax=Acrasis kona TaxID=1008807 RepID=A0AAW2YI75_9EUKA
MQTLLAHLNTLPARIVQPLSIIKHNKSIISHLQNRCIINVVGKDAKVLIQGLTTNDIKRGSAASLFLNPKGRVSFDTLISSHDDDSVSIECDRDLKDSLFNHIRKFKLRSKAEITTPNTAVYNVCGEVENTLNLIKSHKHFYFKDPRSLLIGNRLYVQFNQIDEQQEFEYKLGSEFQETNIVYERLRVLSGIPEGPIDFTPEHTTPFELNADYLNAVDYNKGCYIGQELTARTHFTGQVRKRIMIIYGHEQEAQLPITGTQFDNKGGEMKTNLGDVGLAVVRIEKKDSLSHDGKNFHVITPPYMDELNNEAM